MAEQLPLPNLVLPKLTQMEEMAKRARKAALEKGLCRALGLSKEGLTIWRWHYSSPQGQLETLTWVIERFPYLDGPDMQQRIAKLRGIVGTKIPFLLCQESTRRAIDDWFRG
jgi:hypothetical protein